MRSLIRVYAPYVLLLLAAAAAGARWDAPAYLSMVTGWLWCATAVVCFFVWSILGERPDADGLPRFMLYFGLLTIAVMLDGAFQLHERAALRFPAGDKAIFAAYLGMTIVGARLHRHEIRKSEVRLLASALVFLGLSLLFNGPRRGLWEDGFKLLGAAGWLGYFTTTGSRALRLSFAVPFKSGPPAKGPPAVPA